MKPFSFFLMIGSVKYLTIDADGDADYVDPCHHKNTYVLAKCLYDTFGGNEDGVGHIVKMYNQGMVHKWRRQETDEYMSDWEAQCVDPSVLSGIADFVKSSGFEIQPFVHAFNKIYVENPIDFDARYALVEALFQSVVPLFSGNQQVQLYHKLISDHVGFRVHPPWCDPRLTPETAQAWYHELFPWGF